MTGEFAAWDPLGQQRAFRRLLDAFARPGEVAELPGRPPATAWLQALAMLCDREVSLADPAGLLAPEERRFLQARAAAPNDARFVLLDGRAPVPEGFSPCLGSLTSPERGATLVLVCAGVGQGPARLSVTGPGVPGRRLLCLAGLDGSWLDRRARWVSRFPVGVDLLLSDAGRVAALPRTTRVEPEVDR